MPTAIFSFKIDSDKVSVAHIFFGEDDAEAEASLKAHAEICPKFGPAYRGGKTVEIPVDMTELPPVDPDELQDWLDDEFLGEDEEESDEEEDEEE